MTEVVANIGKVPYVTSIQAREFSIISDEPDTIGGQNKGMTPYELLASSLASCTSITAMMYAIRKGYQVSNIQTRVRLLEVESDVQFEKTLFIAGDVSEEDLQKILLVAKKCPTHKILEKSSYIGTEIKLI